MPTSSGRVVSLGPKPWVTDTCRDRIVKKKSTRRWVHQLIAKLHLLSVPATATRIAQQRPVAQQSHPKTQRQSLWIGTTSCRYSRVPDRWLPTRESSCALDPSFSLF